MKDHVQLTVPKTVREDLFVAAHHGTSMNVLFMFNVRKYGETNIVLYIT